MRELTAGKGGGNAGNGRAVAPGGPWRRIDFMRYRLWSAVCSFVLLVAAIGSLAVNGLNLGIDFTGGTLVEVRYLGPVAPGVVGEVLDGSEFRGAAVQPFGTPRELLIRVPPNAGPGGDKALLSERLLTVLRAGGREIEMRRVEFVGPQVGEELTRAGALAVLYALGGILVYVSLRFQFRFSLGAIAALVHDVLIVLGFFSFTRMDFDLSVLAALLAVVGYSLNDTIVIFDRLRERFRHMIKATPVEVINTSLNQTLRRTLVTSLTTLLVLFALFLLGGEIIRAFSVALIVGVLIGTYSSIYVASAVTLALGVSRQDLVPAEKEGAP